MYLPEVWIVGLFRPEPQRKIAPGSFLALISWSWAFAWQSFGFLCYNSGLGSKGLQWYELTSYMQFEICVFSTRSLGRIGSFSSSSSREKIAIHNNTLGWFSHGNRSECGLVVAWSSCKKKRMRSWLHWGGHDGGCRRRRCQQDHRRLSVVFFQTPACHWESAWDRFYLLAGSTGVPQLNRGEPRAAAAAARRSKKSRKH
jgi:hypothetical protein